MPAPHNPASPAICNLRNRLSGINSLPAQFIRHSQRRCVCDLTPPPPFLVRIAAPPPHPIPCQQAFTVYDLVDATPQMPVCSVTQRGKSLSVWGAPCQLDHCFPFASDHLSAKAAKRIGTVREYCIHSIYSAYGPLYIPYWVFTRLSLCVSGADAA